MKLWWIPILALPLAGACGEGSGNGASIALNRLFDQYKEYQFRTYPEYATYNGYHAYNDQLMDLSAEAGNVYADSIAGFLEALEAVGRESLPSEEQVHYDLFAYELRHSLKEHAFRIGRYLAFNQQNGYHIYFPQIADIQPLETNEEVNDYLQRLALFPRQTGNIIETLKQALYHDITLACPVADQVLQQLQGLAVLAPQETPFYQVVSRSEVLEARSGELLAVIDTAVLPAYGRLWQFFEKEYHPFCRNAPGISALPGGAGYYEYLVQHYTNSDLTPDSVFAIGMAEVERIRTALEAVRDELGFAGMSLPEFFDHLRTDPAYYFTNKEALLDKYRGILARMDEKLPALFGKLPETPYDLKEMEPYRAAAAPAAYYYPAPDDGSRPGYFYVNTHRLDARPVYTMTALALHEAVPGHHLQFALAAEQESVPWFRKQMRVTAFEEGWGLYAEYLGYESGMYEDPLQRVGALAFEMWRACRLVVDVGVHHYGWDRNRAVDFLRANAPLSELDIQSEIDRYISWPGQALAYKIGELRMKALRERAEQALGEKFDIRGFHDAMLSSGGVTLDLMEAQVDRWVESVRSR